MPTRKNTSTNFENEKANKACPVTFTLDIIGGRWKALILWQLTQRYNEIRKGIPNITEKMLIEKLKELEADGLVTRKAMAVVPPHVEYSLSAKGKTLCPVLDAIAKWGFSQM
jgi:DNA-binding HxlR family transcriptional regulator